MTAVNSTGASKHSSTGHTVSDDKDLRKKLAVAFAESASANYHRLETTKLAWTLLTHNVECFSVFDVTIECADAAHGRLKQNVADYLGCFEVDRGDPLTFSLVVDYLMTTLSCYVETTTPSLIVMRRLTLCSGSSK
jgi:hypothetical protein